MHDAPHLPSGDPDRRPDPDLDPRPDWRAQAKWDFRRGYALLAVSITGLIAALALTPSNLIEVIFHSASSQGMATGLKFAAIASVSLAMILGLFAAGLRSISRGRQVEDEVRRWASLSGYRERLSAQEYLSLLEMGPPREKPDDSSQLSLFHSGGRSLRPRWWATAIARIMRLA